MHHAAAGAAPRIVLQQAAAVHADDRWQYTAQYREHLIR